MGVHDLLLAAAARNPDAEVLVVGARRITYRELVAAATSLAGWLVAGGLEPGGRVAILTDDPFGYVAAYFGALLAGGVAVGLNTQTSARTLRETLADCGATALLTRRRYLGYMDGLTESVPSLARLAVADGLPSGTSGVELEPLFHLGGRSSPPLPTTAPSDLAQIIYTSGTTGRPKGVALRHANLVANTRSILAYLELTPQDRAMVVLPFFYSYGNSVLLTHVAVGGTLVVNQSLVYPNVVLDQMAAESVTGLPGVPSTFSLLLHRSAIRARSFPALRYVTQAGGAMPAQTARELAEALPGARLFVMYGQTEASARLTYLDPADLARKPGSVGRPIPGVTLRVAAPTGEAVAAGEVGEVVVRGENVMAGYWGQPDATAEVLRGGELWTGDLGRVDREGFLFLVGRRTEMIKSGAHRISPVEIEEVLAEHRAVSEAAVLGVDDALLGQTIKAFVVRKPGEECSERDLRQHCRKILSAYKVPHGIEFLAELPKTESGKVKKGEIGR